MVLRVSAILPVAPDNCSVNFAEAFVFASCASSERTVSSYGVGSILNSTSPFLTSAIRLDRNLNHAAAYLRHHVDNVLEHANISARRCDDIQQQNHHRETDDRNEGDGDLSRDIPR